MSTTTTILVTFAEEFGQTKYTYLCDFADTLSPGDFVLVPVRRDHPLSGRVGVVVAIDEIPQIAKKFDFRWAIQRVDATSFLDKVAEKHG